MGWGTLKENMYFRVHTQKKKHVQKNYEENWKWFLLNQTLKVSRNCKKRKAKKRN